MRQGMIVFWDAVASAGPYANSLHLADNLTDNHTNTSPLSFYRPDALPAAKPTVSKQNTMHCLFQAPFLVGERISLQKNLQPPPPNGCQIVCYKSIFFDRDSELRIYHRNFLLTGNKLEITRH